MNLNEYQKHALSTLLPQCENYEYLTLGLVGEAGEVGNKVKKMLRGDYDSDELDKILLGELGDALYYIVTLAHRAGHTAEDIAQFNVQKLADRAKRGKIQGDGDSR